MKKESVEKEINKAIKKYIPEESEPVKEYIADLIKITFEGLQQEHEIDERTGRPYSDSRNIAFAISITLDDADTPSILKEAREETKILHKPTKGYFGVWFFDDNGKCKNHWLSEKQTKFCKEREDAVAYIEEVKSWNAISFTQTLIYLVD